MSACGIIAPKHRFTDMSFFSTNMQGCIIFQMLEMIGLPQRTTSLLIVVYRSCVVVNRIHFIFQVVTKPHFKFLEDPLFREVSILAWDPANFSSTLENWYNHPDYNLFPVYKRWVGNFWCHRSYTTLVTYNNMLVYPSSRC